MLCVHVHPCLLQVVDMYLAEIARCTVNSIKGGGVKLVLLTQTKFWLNNAQLVSFLCSPIMCLYLLSSVLWCPLRVPHKPMFGSSLHPVVCRMAHVLFMIFVFPSRTLGFTTVFGGFRVAHRLSFLCCDFALFVLVLCPVFPVPLDCLNCPFGFL
jgi:hypothetical protein